MSDDIISIIGLPIELNRPRDGLCPDCGSMTATIGKGAGPHAARLDCSNCGKFRGWLPALAAEALVDTVTRYGGWPDVALRPLSEVFKATQTEGKAMAKISEVFPSKYLKASDLQGNEHKVIIAGVVTERFSDDTKPVVSFRGWTKTCPINKVVSLFLADALGDDTEAWVGKAVIILPTTQPFQGKTFPVVRFRMPAARDAKMPVSTSMPPPAADDGEEPPFDM
jgi:hypothetical protein